uniref:ASABF-6Cys-alpha n=1 Tax=Ascaris suum TaxID=6253 RepID=Q8IAC8_ASCSU
MKTIAVVVLLIAVLVITINANPQSTMDNSEDHNVKRDLCNGRCKRMKCVLGASCKQRSGQWVCVCKRPKDVMIKN